MEQIIVLAAQIYKLLIIAAAVLSWIPLDPFHPVIKFINSATEPVFARIREVVPPVSGFDLSPVIAFLGVILLERVLVWLI